MKSDLTREREALAANLFLQMSCRIRRIRPVQRICDGNFWKTLRITDFLAFHPGSCVGIVVDRLDACEGWLSSDEE